MNRQNPKTNGKSKTKQTISHKETYTYALTKRKEKKILKKRENKKEESNQTNKQTLKRKQTQKTKLTKRKENNNNKNETQRAN